MEAADKFSWWGLVCDLGSWGYSHGLYSGLLVVECSTPVRVHAHAHWCVCVDLCGLCVCVCVRMYVCEWCVCVCVRLHPHFLNQKQGFLSGAISLVIAEKFGKFLVHLHYVTAFDAGSTLFLLKFILS